jgi:hypothetical protein
MTSMNSHHIHVAYNKININKKIKNIYVYVDGGLGLILKVTEISKMSTK